MSAWKINAKEDTLEMFNDLLEDFRSCTPCVDYPSYQDGEEDDGINQCWKFYSHGADSCRGECLKIAARQGSIKNIQYGIYEFKKTRKSTVSEFERNLSNIFVSVSAVIFVATSISFLATKNAYSTSIGCITNASKRFRLSINIGRNRRNVKRLDSELSIRSTDYSGGVMSHEEKTSNGSD